MIDDESFHKNDTLFIVPDGIYRGNNPLMGVIEVVIGCLRFFSLLLKLQPTLLKLIENLRHTF